MKVSLYAWWVFLLITLFVLSFVRLAQAATEGEPEIPLYEPPKEEGLPSPVKEDTPQSQTAPTSSPQKLPETIKAAPTQPPQHKLSRGIMYDLPDKPGFKFFENLHLEGGDFKNKAATLTNIRFSKKKYSSRIVLDFSSRTLPWCYVTYNDHQKYNLIVECAGVRNIKIPANWRKKSSKIKGLDQNPKPVLVEEDQMTLHWVLKKDYEIKAFHLQNHGRLVIDMIPRQNQKR